MTQISGRTRGLIDADQQPARMTLGHANLSIEAHAAAARGISHVSSDGMLAAVDIQAAADSARPSTDDFGRMYGVAWLQAMVVYYGVSFFLHYVVPVLVNPKGVRELGEIQSSSHTRRDAIRALIPVCIVRPHNYILAPCSVFLPSPLLSRLRALLALHICTWLMFSFSTCRNTYTRTHNRASMFAGRNPSFYASCCRESAL